MSAQVCEIIIWGSGVAAAADDVKSTANAAQTAARAQGFSSTQLKELSGKLEKAKVNTRTIADELRHWMAEAVTSGSENPASPGGS